jgi:hypothetical protein
MMFILNDELYLKVELSPEIGRTHISLSSRESTFDSWNPQTRISPVFIVNSSEPYKNTLEKNQFLLFLYNCRPADFIKEFGYNKVAVFLTYGLANLLCITENLESIDEIISWSNSKEQRFELWEIKDSLLINVRISERRNKIESIKPLMIEDPIIKVMYEEYLSTFLSLITEVDNYIPKYRNQFDLINEEINNILLNEKVIFEDKIEFLVSVNAGLSRLLVQTFSGSSGVLHNYCPIGNHSLLGIGIANIALINLCEFFDTVIGKEYFPDRVSKMDRIGIDDPNLLHYFDNDRIKIQDAYKQEYINRVGIPKVDKSVPVLPFFSGRDGFKSGNRLNISVPLIVLSSCNCLNWNLLTLTHELSHLQIRGVLSYLKPEDTLQINRLNQIFTSPRDQIKNLFEYGTYLLSLSTIFIDQTRSADFSITEVIGKELSPNFSMKIITDIDETLTHIFDFLYFFDADVKKYLSSIWSSWITIPYIEERIEDYVVRTGTAILSNNLHEANREAYFHTELTSSFDALNTILPHKYFEKAMSLLNEGNSRDRIYNKIIARLPLILLARTLLYSTKVSGKINKELNIYSRHRETDGYKLKMGVFEIDDDKITNPISFLKEYSNEEQSSEKNSLWILYNLSFM